MYCTVRGVCSSELNNNNSSVFREDCLDSMKNDVDEDWVVGKAGSPLDVLTNQIELVRPDVNSGGENNGSGRGRLLWRNKASRAIAMSINIVVLFVIINDFIACIV